MNNQMTEKICPICKKPLTKKQRVYCSAKCAAIGRKRDTTTPVTSICKYCGKDFPFRQDKGVPRKYCSIACYHDDRNQTYKLNTQTSRWCCYCKQHLPLSKFSSPSTTACRECMNKRAKSNENKKKQIIIEYLGGKCIRCGYSKCPAALELHHPDKSNKGQGWAKMRSKHIDVIKKWIDTEHIELICSNCHREEHYLQMHPNLIP